MESIRYNRDLEYISGSFYNNGRKYRIGYDFSSSFICIYNDMEELVLEEGLFAGWQKCLLKIISVFPWS
jgi:hypothetical protein